MNIFQKIALSKKIDEKTEVLKTYCMKIDRYYKQNFLYATWVYHLSEDELKALELEKPYGCCYSNISGDPKAKSTFSPSLTKRLYEIQKNTQSRIKSNKNLSVYCTEDSYNYFYRLEYRRIYEKTMDSLQAERCAKQYADELARDLKIEGEKREKLMKPAQEWAETIGAKTVLVFRTNTSQSYIQMMAELRALLIEIEQTNLLVYGKRPNWKNELWFIGKIIDQFKSADYIIERDK